jgi:hypothetical protein
MYIVPCEQQLLIELAINSGDFWLLLCHVPTNHFINKNTKTKMFKYEMYTSCQ